MKKTPKEKIPTIDEISEMAADGKDVSEYSTNSFRVRQPMWGKGVTPIFIKHYGKIATKGQTKT